MIKMYSKSNETKDTSLKEFMVSGFDKDGLVFCFVFYCSNSAQAVSIASQDELIKDMDFDKLIIEEKHR